MEFIATIKEFTPLVEYSAKFSAMTTIVETDDKYPQTLEVQFSNDAVSLLRDFNVGDVVVMYCDIRGNVWESPKGPKYFTKLVGWKISLAKEVIKERKPLGNIEANFAEAEMDALNEELEDDLPF